MACGTFYHGHNPIKIPAREEQEPGRQMSLSLRQEPRPRLEWMSGLARKLTEALITDRVPEALWVKRHSTHLACVAEQAHPQTKPVTSLPQGLPLIKVR